jgi:hypothetical protein
VLRGTGALAGLGSNSFSASGVLRGAGALLGSAAITITPEAAITGTAAGQITGTAALSFTNSSTLLGAGALLGASASQFIVSMVPGSIRPIAGAVQLSLAATGTLRNSVGVYGPADIIYTRVDEKYSVYVNIHA